MIELSGTAKEISEAVKAIVPDYPVHIIEQLEPGEWHFILNGVDTLVRIDGKKNGKGRTMSRRDS